MTNYRLINPQQLNLEKAPLFRFNRPLKKSEIRLAAEGEVIKTAPYSTAITAEGDYIFVISEEVKVFRKNYFESSWETDPNNPEIYRSKTVVHAKQISEPIKMRLRSYSMGIRDSKFYLCYANAKDFVLFHNNGLIEVMEPKMFKRLYIME